MNTRQYFCGLDLGQASDYSALAIIEADADACDRNDAVYQLRYLHRWPTRTPYNQVVCDTVTLINSPTMQPNSASYPVLAVDATGVGAPIIDLLRRERLFASLEPVMITAGAEETRTDRGFHGVPKRALVSRTQVLLQTQRLRIAKALPLADTLVRELMNFRAKITESGNDTYGAWRESIHDDLVLATALAIWASSRASIGVLI